MNTEILSKNKVETKTVASVLVETLIELGTDSIFGYPGASVLSIYNELSNTNEITHYLVRHEQAAVHAAEGYARVSGKPGIVLVTSGPGFTNTVTGIANAYADSTPLIILAGDVSNNYNNIKTFQAVDIESMVSSCTKKTYILKKHDNIHKVLKEAFYIANSGIKGPVVIALPRNILEMKYNETNNQYTGKLEKEKSLKKEINKLNTILNQAKRPLILVGGGAANASFEVIEFAQKYQIPVVSTLMGIGVFPSDNKLYMGMIGLNGTYAANNILSKCDLLLVFGAAFSDRSTCKKNGFASNAKIVSVNLAHISEDFELEIMSDVKKFLNQFMLKSNIYETNPDWLHITENIKNEFSVQDNSQNCLHSSYVLATLSRYTEKYKPIVVTDVGQHQMLTAQFFHFNTPQKFITSGGLGTMGFGLPAAMGAYISDPNNLVLNITGDGSFQMNLQELATCREHKIPIKIIIMNNGYLGMVRQMQEKIYNNRYQVEMTNPDFVKIAEAYDLYAIRVSNKDELIPAINKAIEHKGTVILDILIDSFEEV